MKRNLIKRKIRDFLQNKPFINLASCDEESQPNVSPKFLLKIINNDVYVIDYNIDCTWVNINFNPRVSISSIDLSILTGYQINGIAEVVEDEEEQRKLLKQFGKKIVELSALRVIKGVRQQRGYRNFEMMLPDRVVIYKIKAEQVIEIDPIGGLKKEVLCQGPQKNAC